MYEYGVMLIEEAPGRPASWFHNDLIMMMMIMVGWLRPELMMMMMDGDGNEDGKSWTHGILRLSR